MSNFPILLIRKRSIKLSITPLSTKTLLTLTLSTSAFIKRTSNDSLSAYHNFQRWNFVLLHNHHSLHSSILAYVQPYFSLGYSYFVSVTFVPMSYSIGNIDTKLHKALRLSFDIKKLLVTISSSSSPTYTFVGGNILSFNGLLAISPLGSCTLLLVVELTTFLASLFYIWYLLHSILVMGSFPM